MKKFWYKIQNVGWLAVFSVACLFIALFYLWKGDAAHVSFWMGLAIYNHITEDRYD